MPRKRGTTIGIMPGLIWESPFLWKDLPLTDFDGRALEAEDKNRIWCSDRLIESRPEKISSTDILPDLQSHRDRALRLLQEVRSDGFFRQTRRREKPVHSG